MSFCRILLNCRASFPDVKIPPIGKLSCLSMLPCGTGQEPQKSGSRSKHQKNMAAQGLPFGQAAKPAYDHRPVRMAGKSAGFACKPQDLPANGSARRPCCLRHAPSRLRVVLRNISMPIRMAAPNNWSARPLPRPCSRIGPVLQATEESATR